MLFFMHYQGDQATPAAIAPTHRIAEAVSAVVVEIRFFGIHA
jgi:hypothetical protein